LRRNGPILFISERRSSLEKRIEREWKSVLCPEGKDTDDV
jgi:hypothetical protein